MSAPAASGPLALADRLRLLAAPDQDPITPAQPVATVAALPVAARWPRCPLCGGSTLDHACDPDATLAALLARLRR